MNQPFTQDELKMILNGIEWAIDRNEGVWSRERHLQYHTLLDRVKGMTHEPTPAEMARDAVRNDREMQFLTNFGIRTASGAFLLSPHHAVEYARLRSKLEGMQLDADNMDDYVAALAERVRKLEDASGAKGLPPQPSLDKLDHMLHDLKSKVMGYFDMSSEQWDILPASVQIKLFNIYDNA